MALTEQYAYAGLLLSRVDEEWYLEERDHENQGAWIALEDGAAETLLDILKELAKAARARIQHLPAKPEEP